MKKIGLTGNIGSGKTTAAKYFKNLGVPVFIADDCAKELMNNDFHLKKLIIELLGTSAYKDGQLNKEFVSKKIFNNIKLLNLLNNLVHPRVNESFNKWCINQNSYYIVYEAALIFENNSQHLFDTIICIKTPVSSIHKRISKRDNYSKERVNKILKNQLSQNLKCSLSDFCIVNTTKEHLYNEILIIHNSILKIN